MCNVRPSLFTFDIFTFNISRLSKPSLASPHHTWEEVIPVLLFFALLALVLWMLGFITGYTLGGFLHLLLLLAVIGLIFQLLSGRPSDVA
jgi:hypothetical protein